MLQRSPKSSSLLPRGRSSFPTLSSSPAQRELPICSYSSTLRSSSPAQWELLHLVPPPSPCYQAAPHSGSSPSIYLPRSSLDRAAPCSGSSPICSLVRPPIKQPRAAEAPVPMCCLLHPPIEQPRAAGAPLFATSSLLRSSSPAQRELPHLQPPPSPHDRAALRSGSSPNCCLVPPQIEQPRAAGAPLERASFLPSERASFLPSIKQPRSLVRFITRTSLKKLKKLKNRPVAPYTAYEQDIRINTTGRYGQIRA